MLRSLVTHVRALSVLLAPALLALPSRARGEDAWVARDKALHFGVSAAIAASSYGVSAVWIEHPLYRFIAGGSVALAVGAGKEAWDAAGHGDPSLKDFTWDVVGALTGAGLALGIDYIVQRTRPRRSAGWQLGVVRF
jgi:putative lipoprotein